MKQLIQYLVKSDENYVKAKKRKFSSSSICNWEKQKYIFDYAANF